LPDGGTNSDSNTPRDHKNSDQGKANPRLDLLGYFVSVAKGLKARLLDLRFFSFSLKHIASLVAQVLFHQGEQGPNAGPHGYQGNPLGLGQAW